MTGLFPSVSSLENDVPLGFYDHRLISALVRKDMALICNRFWIDDSSGGSFQLAGWPLTHAPLLPPLLGIWSKSYD